MGKEKRDKSRNNIKASPARTGYSEERRLDRGREVSKEKVESRQDLRNSCLPPSACSVRRAKQKQPPHSAASPLPIDVCFITFLHSEQPGNFHRDQIAVFVDLPRVPRSPRRTADASARLAMNSFSMNALAKTLPSVCRQTASRTATLRNTRSIASSSSQQASNSKERSRRERSKSLESQILVGAREPANTDKASPLSAITKMMQGGQSSASSRFTSDYSRLAESLEADMMRHPYADRAPPHHLHVFCHKHNTILTLTRPNGNPMLSMGTGQIGFRKGGRAGFDSAYQLSSHVLSQIQERGYLLEIKRLEVVFRGFGKGREAFTKVLLGNEGRNVRGLVGRVTDSTRVKFGGTRSRKVRRLG